MTDPDSREEIVGQLLAARRGGALPGPDLGVRSLECAFAIQAGVTAQLGAVGAFKVARKTGQPTIMAPILANSLYASPADIAPSTFRLIGIELEVGFVVTGALPPADAPDFDARARDAVAAIAAIEIVDTRLADYENADPLQRLADNQLNGGLILGTPVADWHHLNLDTPHATLRLNSDTVLDGAAPVPGGNAFAGFCELARMVGSHCGGLREGHVVITGSLNGMPFVEAGSSVSGHIEGLGTVKARFRGRS